MHGLTPDYITVLATPFVPQRHLRSANDNLLVVLKTQLYYGDITFTLDGPAKCGINYQL